MAVTIVINDPRLNQPANALVQLPDEVLKIVAREIAKDSTLTAGRNLVSFKRVCAVTCDIANEVEFKATIETARRIWVKGRARLVILATAITTGGWIFSSLILSGNGLKQF